MIIYLEYDHEYLNSFKIDKYQTHIYEEFTSARVLKQISVDNNKTWMFEPIDYEQAPTISYKTIKRTLVNETRSRDEDDIITKNRFLKQIYTL